MADVTFVKRTWAFDITTAGLWNAYSLLVADQHNTLNVEYLRMMFEWQRLILTLRCTLDTSIYVSSGKMKNDGEKYMSIAAKDGHHQGITC